MNKIPQHIGFIMDGNGRWASGQGLKRLDGHRKGVETVRQIMDVCATLGVPYLTFYAFSSENWKRPEEEVLGLMNLLRHYFTKELNSVKEKGFKVKIFGDKRPGSRLDQDIVKILLNVEEETAHNTGPCVNFCINYGARDEIVRAAQIFADDVEKGVRFVGDLDEALFSAYLDSAHQPDVDLVIRTSGEQRLSNFLMWQAAYAELSFTPTPWPEFTVDEFHKILEDYAGRERRLGDVKSV